MLLSLLLFIEQKQKPVEVFGQKAKTKKMQKDTDFHLKLSGKTISSKVSRFFVTKKYISICVKQDY